MSKSKPSTSMTHWLENHAATFSFFLGHPCIYAQETVLQSGVRSSILPGLPTHLVQELNVGTVAVPMSSPFVYISMKY